MKNSIQHAVYGEITYEEGFWSGKKTVTINGQPLQKMDKKTFTWQRGEDTGMVTVKGNIMVGVSLQIAGETIWVVPKVVWYEWILGLIPFILLIAWGNSPVLCSIFPIVGGALGGVIGGLGLVLFMYLSKGKKFGIKLLLSLVMLVATFGVAALTLIALIPVLIL